MNEDKLGSTSADIAVAYALYRYYGYYPDDISVVLLSSSEKAIARGMNYVKNIITAVTDRVYSQYK